MKTVTLTADLRPWRAGDDIHVEDDLAKRLVSSGEAKDMRPFQPAASYETKVVEAEPAKARYKTKASA
ncbi:hypothetical protein ACQZ4Q_08115 [Agrobacterium vitis]